MRPLAVGALLTGLLLMRAPSAEAQYAAAQDSSLQGLQRVYVNYQTTPGALDPQLNAELASAITLELRKSGLRVARDIAELELGDAILNIGFIEISRALSTDLALRMDVEQFATLTRTNQRLRMVTWFYEDDRRNVLPKDVAREMATKAVNQFLSVWLDMNNR